MKFVRLILLLIGFSFLIHFFDFVRSAATSDNDEDKLSHAVISVLSSEKMSSGNADCHDFSIEENEIVIFFAKSNKITKRTYLESYYSPCKIIGLLNLSDGIKYDFVIQSSGAAMLYRDEGAEEEFLWNEPIWSDPYAGTYGLSN